MTMGLERLLRGILYVRRSTKKQEESLEQQIAWGLRIAASLGVVLNVSVEMLNTARQQGLSSIGDLYIDDSSGARRNRPGHAAFRERALNDKRITHCFFWQRDRFSRIEWTYKALEAETVILRSGKHTITSGHCCKPRERFPTEADRAEDIMLLLEYGNASAYRPNLAKGVMRGQANNALKGYWNGGRPPYGFRRAAFEVATGRHVWAEDNVPVVGKGKKAIILPGDDAKSREQQNVVRRIHQLFASGLGGKRIADILNREGVPSADAGRTRDGVPVSGTWLASNVYNIIENPCYAARSAWGRRNEGSVRRYDPKAPESSREAREDEVFEASGGGRKKVHRDCSVWTFAEELPVPYPPVVDPELASANYRRLRCRGEKLATRGVPKSLNPNDVPFPVICGDCGQPMTMNNASGFPSRFLCGTYQRRNSKRSEESCNHNWVEHDVVVGFALKAVSKRLDDLGKRTALKEAIREVLQASSRAVSSTEGVRLKAELEKLDANCSKAYEAQLTASDEERTDARNCYDRLKLERERTRKRLDDFTSRLQLTQLDEGAEVEKAAALLDELHLQLTAIPVGRLRETFEALGARMTVEFEHPETGHRRNVPKCGKLVFGEGAGFNFPKPTETSGRRGFDTPSPSGPSLSQCHRDGMLGKDGRGERI